MNNDDDHQISQFKMGKRFERHFRKEYTGISINADNSS